MIKLSWLRGKVVVEERPRVVGSKTKLISEPCTVLLILNLKVITSYSLEKDFNLILVEL
jgi:hypothetical protein